MPNAISKFIRLQTKSNQSIDLYLMKRILLALFLFTTLFSSAQNQANTIAYGALPTVQQIEWHQMELTAFIHFNMNTFTDKEWGDGSEKPELFNPTKLDCNQWAATLKNAGFKGIIITAKHHDGFCLWPSAYTKHSVKYSPWKNGQGDVIRELADACQKHGLKLGIYYSPWDRNHAEYGKADYLNYFGNQLAELLTNYGDVFEVWFDGANGGTGYYGGANEKREVDRLSYYNWPEVFKYVKKLKPNALIFSDGGPDIRWVGNEDGLASETNWCTLNRDEFYPGGPNYHRLGKGSEKGTHWVPAEVDVSLRPGWYYHPREDHRVKSLNHLMDIYYSSIGRNANLLLNIPVDRRGLISQPDSIRLMEFADALKHEMTDNLARKANLSQTTLQGIAKPYSISILTDNDPATYWMPETDTATTGSFIIDFKKTVIFNRFVIQEPIGLGQRIKEFNIDYWSNNAWQPLTSGTTIGYKRILRFPTSKTTKIRFSVKNALAKPLVSEIGTYLAPALLLPPQLTRDQAGTLSMSSSKGLNIFYTTDGTTPNTNSLLYNTPFNLKNRGTINAVAYDPTTKKYSSMTTRYFDVCAEKFRLLKPQSAESGYLFDDDHNTSWVFKTTVPFELVLDLQQTYNLKGFTYLPDQANGNLGTILHYGFETSMDGKTWKKHLEKAEFQNIANHPIQQEVQIEATQARFIKLVVHDLVAKNHTSIGIAEIGVLTKEN